jgi:hypothetical protein
MPALFPLYRRSSNGRHYYRIEGPRAFTEVQLVGAGAVIHRVVDAAYPEQVRIDEMVGLAGGLYVALDPAEFDRMLDLHSGI